MALDQEGAGHVVVVSLEERAGGLLVQLQPRLVGRSRIRRLDVDAAEVSSQDELIRRLREIGDPDTILDVRLVGVLPDRLDLVEDEVEEQLAGSFLRFRIRNQATPALADTTPPPPDTVAGAFLRELETKIAAAETAGAPDVAAEHREALRLGRLLLDDPARVTLV